MSTLSGAKHSLFATPRTFYEDFRSLLQEQLDQDTTFKARYLRAELESKMNDTAYAEGPELRRAAAIDKWLRQEVQNGDTSVRLMMSDESDLAFIHDLRPVFCHEVLGTASRFVRQVLGTTIPWDELRGSFSGGASTKVRRGVGTIARKYQEGSNITEMAIMSFLRLTSEFAGWAPRDFDLVKGNVMFTVPKSSVIDRVAAKEPEYNMYVQKAIGDYIRSRLMRVGINLNKQEINQSLAKVGSVEGNLATVDLSSASDSITTQLVMKLVPDEWFALMDDVRSHVTWIDGVAHDNVMFSSMGNGFTFELESLIFWALTRAVAYHCRISGRISVYGDDIICPIGIKDALLEMFTFCGFKINVKKSFFEGDFRESCGKHWFKGVDVSPFYVKKVPENVSDWCHLLNSLRKWSSIGSGIADPDYYSLWLLFAEELIPKPLWGGWDLDVRHNLVAPGRFPIASLKPSNRSHEREERDLAVGLYLEWLATTDERPEQTEVVTSGLKSDGSLKFAKAVRPSIIKGIPHYPQEIEGV